MINDKYTLEHFEALAKGSREREDYLNELQHEVAQHLDSIVRGAFAEVANKLKELGHNLSESEHSYSSDYGSWSYEFTNAKDTEHPRIWLHTQVGAMSGYVSEHERNT